MGNRGPNNSKKLPIGKRRFFTYFTVVASTVRALNKESGIKAVCREGEIEQTLNAGTMPHLYWYRFGLPLAALANSSEHASHGALFPIRQYFHESHPLRRAPLLPFATSGKPTHFPSLPLPSIPHKPPFSSPRHHSKAFLGKLLRRSKHPEKEKIEGKESARNGDDSCEKLPSGVRREMLPRHVAVIMDGNSRWARTKGLPTWAGHEAGYRSLQEMVKLSCRWGIRVLTVFAFSFENWLRPKVEVDFLMVLIEGALKENIKYYLSEGIRVRIIGDSSRLPNSLQKIAKETQEKTETNSRLELNIAVSYSGRKDITQACQKIAWKVQHGLLDSADISESLIDQELETNRSNEFPCPDLLIRTGGELRLSNFLLWQSAYTELFFTKTLWPDFGEPEYIEVLCSFQERERRFGQRIT
ncbi:cis-prenyltransferase 4, chloroplastic-like [Phoenix dactylifera]|uniref:Cis-prenyltransferase 4, chloroplastic-like n=1 Tax=Phoenix dactylifera TaxID=42345 RepID=A0A8B8ZEG3_PHODC|nr:cis-prenyltransferase 4, chloroplastic-like [Phoenix dactylifera]